jgi:NAD(P)-dependent dehydrogenase (short-subunit alcohol dehydrogenase family)
MTVAIVTGASRGIGAAIARRLAEEGFSVAVTARTQAASDSPFAGTIHETVEQIRTAGGNALAIPADLSKSDDRHMIVERTENELGPVDVLVNNAAVTWFEPVSEVAGRHYELMFEIQVRAPFELAQLVLPGMRARHRGWILNISSLAAVHPQGPPYRWRAGGTVYGMCKAALERFTSGLAAEVYEDGIAVNCLSPSSVVATPGVLHHGLLPPGSEHRAEPVEQTAGAALALVTGDPATVTGMITYTRDVL